MAPITSRHGQQMPRSVHSQLGRSCSLHTRGTGATTPTRPRHATPRTGSVDMQRRSKALELRRRLSAFTARLDQHCEALLAGASGGSAAAAAAGAAAVQVIDRAPCGIAATPAGETNVGQALTGVTGACDGTAITETEAGATYGQGMLRENRCPRASSSLFSSGHQQAEEEVNWHKEEQRRRGEHEPLYDPKVTRRFCCIIPRDSRSMPLSTVALPGDSSIVTLPRARGGGFAQLFKSGGLQVGTQRWSRRFAVDGLILLRPARSAAGYVSHANGEGAFSVDGLVDDLEVWRQTLRSGQAGVMSLVTFGAGSPQLCLSLLTLLPTICHQFSDVEPQGSDEVDPYVHVSGLILGPGANSPRDLWDPGHCIAIETLDADLTSRTFPCGAVSVDALRQALTPVYDAAAMWEELPSSGATVGNRNGRQAALVIVFQWASPRPMRLVLTCATGHPSQVAAVMEQWLRGARARQHVDVLEQSRVNGSRSEGLAHGHQHSRSVRTSNCGTTDTPVHTPLGALLDFAGSRFADVEADIKRGLFPSSVLVPEIWLVGCVRDDLNGDDLRTLQSLSLSPSEPMGKTTQRHNQQQCKSKREHVEQRELPQQPQPQLHMQARAVQNSKKVQSQDQIAFDTRLEPSASQSRYCYLGPPSELAPPLAKRGAVSPPRHYAASSTSKLTPRVSTNSGRQLSQSPSRPRRASNSRSGSLSPERGHRCARPPDAVFHSTVGTVPFIEADASAPRSKDCDPNAHMSEPWCLADLDLAMKARRAHDQHRKHGTFTPRQVESCNAPRQRTDLSTSPAQKRVPTAASYEEEEKSHEPPALSTVGPWADALQSHLLAKWQKGLDVDVATATACAQDVVSGSHWQQTLKTDVATATRCAEDVVNGPDDHEIEDREVPERGAQTTQKSSLASSRFARDSERWRRVVERQAAYSKGDYELSDVVKFSCPNVARELKSHPKTAASDLFPKLLSDSSDDDNEKHSRGRIQSTVSNEVRTKAVSEDRHPPSFQKEGTRGMVDWWESPGSAAPENARSQSQHHEHILEEDFIDERRVKTDASRSAALRELDTRNSSRQGGEGLDADLHESQRLRLERCEAPRREIKCYEIQRREVEQHARHEAQRRQAERLELERIENERREAELLEHEKRAAARRQDERLEMERRESDRREAERLEFEKREIQRRETELLERERAEAARRTNERIQAEKHEAERREAERIELERLENERREIEMLENERREAARLENERLEIEKREADRREAERIELERFKNERREIEIHENERREAMRRENERLEIERREADRREVERLELEKHEAEQRENELLQLQKEEDERREQERKELEKRRAAEFLEVEKHEAARQESERLEIERREAERRATEHLQLDGREINRIEIDSYEQKERETAQRNVERFEIQRCEVNLAPHENDHRTAELHEVEKHEAEKGWSAKIEHQRCEAESSQLASHSGHVEAPFEETVTSVEQVTSFEDTDEEDAKDTEVQQASQSKGLVFERAESEHESESASALESDDDASSPSMNQNMVVDVSVPPSSQEDREEDGVETPTSKALADLGNVMPTADRSNHNGFHVAPALPSTPAESSSSACSSESLDGLLDSLGID